MLKAIPILLLAITAFAPSPREDKKLAPVEPTVSSGVYIIKGREGGTNYQGLAVIQKLDDRYIIIYQVGHATYSATAMLEGDRLAASWRSGQLQGVTLYKVEGDRLRGNWVALPKTEKNLGRGVEDLVLKERFKDEPEEDAP